MKTTTFFPLLIALFLLVTSTTIGQSTITQNNFPRGFTFTDSLVVVSQSTVPLPTEGAAQTWDYSSWTTGSIEIDQYIDATSDPIYTNANHSLYRIGYKLLFGFPVNTTTFDKVDSLGWYRMGAKQEFTKYSLAAFGGGATDSIYFLESDDLYAGRINFLNFPATYQSQWTKSREEVYPFEVTIAAFGLNKTPGTVKIFIDRTQRVVGYGTLVMPQLDGNPSSPLDVILVKNYETELDSVYLGGAPAPAAILNAFGVIQGAIKVDSFYTFYTPGFGANILGITDDGGVGKSPYYRPQAVNTILAITNIQVNTNSICFPNPIQTEQTLTIQTNKTIDAAHLIIVDVQGRVVFEKGLRSVNDNQYQCKLPNTLAAGVYFYQLVDEQTKHHTQGQFQVK